MKESRFKEIVKEFERQNLKTIVVTSILDLPSEVVTSGAENKK